jgi:hypothetical protein
MKDVRFPHHNVYTEVRSSRSHHCTLLKVWGAGLCVQDSAQRGQIISLIDACEARTGWPMSTLREDLHKEWQKADSDDQDQDIRSII